MQATEAPAHEQKRPMIGAQYLESLRDGREIWLNGEQVQDVTTHLASATVPARWRGCTMPCMIPSSRTCSPARHPMALSLINPFSLPALRKSY